MLGLSQPAGCVLRVIHGQRGLDVLLLAGRRHCDHPPGGLVQFLQPGGNLFDLAGGTVPVTQGLGKFIAQFCGCLAARFCHLRGCGGLHLCCPLGCGGLRLGRLGFGFARHSLPLYGIRPEVGLPPIILLGLSKPAMGRARFLQFLRAVFLRPRGRYHRNCQLFGRCLLRADGGRIFLGRVIVILDALRQFRGQHRHSLQVFFLVRPCELQHLVALDFLVCENPKFFGLLDDAAEAHPVCGVLQSRGEQLEHPGAFHQLAPP